MVSTNKGISIFPMEDIICLVGLSNIPLFLFKERAFRGGYSLIFIQREGISWGLFLTD